MSEKKWITIRLDFSLEDVVEGPLETLMERIQASIERQKRIFPELKNFSLDRVYDYGSEYTAILAERLETDQEFKYRLRNEARKAVQKEKDALKKEKAEMKLLAELKKKYEKKTEALVGGGANEK